MSDKPVPEPVTRSLILFYQSEDGTSRIEVLLEEGTVWLSQARIAALYQITKQTTGHHIRNIFDENELSPEATVRQHLTVQTEGTRTVQRSIEYYNLNMILAIGYRVRSHRGTQFRRWATERLSEYLIKGFVLDDERLREGRSIGVDYFDELLEASGISGHPRSGSTRRSGISTHSRSITTHTQKQRLSFSKSCRTNCIGQSPAILLRRSSQNGLTH